MSYRYRLHAKRLPGNLDLVSSGRKKVIFVYGCCWHGHPGCCHDHLPNSRIELWSLKIDRNCERDRDNIASLEVSGWQVLSVWQCERKDIETLANRVNEFIESE